MEYERWIRSYKSRIARYKETIIIYEEEVGGSGESSIIRYY